MKKIVYLLILLAIAAGSILIYENIVKYINENKVLTQVIDRLSADSRTAEVLVTDLRYDENTKKTYTTIKFLEYDTQQKPLAPKSFTFAGNIIQFQSLVIRFDDLSVKMERPFKDKSAYLFWKAFMLDGAHTQEFEITKLGAIPAGYKIEGTELPFERRLWERFWQYALDPNEAKRIGIKNAQIEAPGTMFIPGTLYTIKIEHDGGLRIDAQPLPQILRGERIPK